MEARPIIAIDTEGNAEKPWGLSFTIEARTGYVIRATDREGLAALDEWIDIAQPIIVLHNSLYDLAVLRAMGIDLTGRLIVDTMCAAYLLGLEPQSLKPLAYRRAGMVQADYMDIVGPAQDAVERRWLESSSIPETVKARGRQSKIGIRRWWKAQRPETLALDPRPIPEATLDDVDPEVAVRYAARDADATLRIYGPLQAEITALGLDDVLAADLAAVPMIDRMQTIGLKVDLDHYEDLKAIVALRLETLASQIRFYGGPAFNPGSSDQVAHLLFDQLRLPATRRTESGKHCSTADKYLEALRQHHPVVPLILDWREADKMRSTYLDPLPGFVQKDGRLHPRFRITRVASGRLSASDPNVLAFPKHSELGKLFRMGIVAEADHELGEWDLDQIEMRVMAHESHDPTMISEFLSGVDKHTATASRIFGKDPRDITRAQRFAAKAVNFGILMGMTPYGLHDQFAKHGQAQWTVEHCSLLLSEYFRIYPLVRGYISDKHAEARRYGYVRDMWGRLRHVGGIHASDRRVQEEALRQAQATPIQSGAQGIMKRIMAALWPELQRLSRHVWVEPLLQIHDALLLEYTASARHVLHDLVIGRMSDTVTLRVPVTAKASWGRRWGDLD